MISSSVLASLIASALLSAVWPVAIFLVCRGRMTLSGRNVMVGAGVFFVSSQVLEKALHLYVLKANAASAAWLHAHAFGYALYGCIAAALFEETGRYLGMRYLVKPSGNPGTAVAYGLGHGGLESILIGSLGMAQAFALAMLLNSGQLDATLGRALAPDALASLHAGLERLSVVTAGLSAIERLIALLIQLGLSLLVWRAVETRRPAFLALAFLLHAAIDFPAGLAQAGRISSTVVEGALLVVGTGLAAFFLYALPRKATSPAHP
jgi:uncharacterized membrane protein YhfC